MTIGEYKRAVRSWSKFIIEISDRQSEYSNKQPADGKEGKIIPFGIAYESDLNKAQTLALSAAGGINRILKIPEPKCLLLECGDSTVNLELRVWIDDLQNGIVTAKDDVGTHKTSDRPKFITLADAICIHLFLVKKLKLSNGF